MLTARSVCGGGGVEENAVPESFSEFGSVAVEAVATFVQLAPAGALEGTCAVRTNAAVVPAVIEAAVQLTCPFVPTAGVVQLNPAGALSETNVSG